MSHYYKNDRNLSEEIETLKVNIKGIEYSFLTQAGVFSKSGLDFGSRILIETIRVSNDTKKIADIGCGYGPIGLSLANENKDSIVYMYDVNERAVSLAIKNAEINNIKNVNINVNYILKDVKETFDLIVTNPPIRAGKDVVFSIYEQAFLKLNKGGSFYCVIQKKQGAPSSLTKINELFLNAEIIVKKSGYWIIFARK